MMISEENWGMERFMGDFRGKLKRKEAGEIDQVSYEFSDFSLSSRPNKIRRLVFLVPYFSFKYIIYFCAKIAAFSL